MPLFLGIDGGASNTRCVLGNERSILGRGQGPSSNVVRVGEAAAGEALSVAILEACRAARVSPQDIASTCVGAAGCDRPGIRSDVQAVLAEIVSGDISVVGDMQIALQAAFANGPGVIVIAGTGSIAYGRTESGELARAGGWGFAVSDEGSGYWIGRRAVAFALRDCDQRGCWESELLSELMKAFRVHTHEEFILKVNGNPPPNFAQLAPVVIGLAERDDRVAMEVCSTAADELSELALLVLRKLFSNEERVQVGISGGVFAHSALVRHAFCNHLGRKFPVAAVNPSIVEPALGALELARQRFAAEMSRS